VRYVRVLMVVVACCLLPAGAVAQEPPLPELNFAGPIQKKPCKSDADDPYEQKFYEAEGWEAPEYERYPGICQRLKFSYPVVVKPGQNDVLVGPLTIEQPRYDGYVTRFEPNLVTETGEIPPVHEVHLHHGTWLSAPTYGNGPFFAAGEEKTIAPFPKGYGMPVKATDEWLLLYMVHSAVTEPMTVFITYEIDYIAKADGDAIGMKPALPVWLDVRPSGYPVFNVQRKFGGDDGQCTWPKEQCAEHDPYGKEIVGQGQPGNGKGYDYTLPAAGENFGSTPFKGGTLIGLGGHLHPGGLQNEIDLVRGEDAQRIYNGVPTYWDVEDKTKGGGPPDSWDFSMRVSGLPYWGVRVKPGDVLRSNATYDTTLQATYENMGIAVGLLVPDDENGEPQAPGLDPFTAPKDTSERCDSGGLAADTPTLCVNGILETHGHYAENAYRGGPEGEWTETDAPLGSALGGVQSVVGDLTAALGRPTNLVAIAGFLYEPGDLTTAATTGIPQVKLGTDLTFVNADGALAPHTITTCKFPCLGPTGAAFPIANGETSSGRQLDLDSSELGVGIPYITGMKNRLDWTVPVTEEEGFEPGETVTYYCRIHPSMRGAFKVTD